MEHLLTIPQEKRFKFCLDKGYVQLVDWMGSDLSVARAARVSYNAAWRTGISEGSDSRLISYMMDHRHTTPFEHGCMTYEIKAPIFVYRQWHRHRTQSYNEMSARYTNLPEEWYVPDPAQIGVQDPKNKQGRITEDLTEEQLRQVMMDIEDYDKGCQRSYQLYTHLLARGWPRELARACLPFSMYSKMFVTLNLWNFFHFASLRCDAHAQYEIRVFADAMLEIAEEIFPVSVAAWRTMSGFHKKDL